MNLEQDPSQNQLSIDTDLSIADASETTPTALAQQLGQIHWREKGQQLLKAESWQQAIDCFQQALQFQPLDRGIWQSYCLALDRLGRYSDVIAAYDQALKFHPKDATFWYNRGVVIARRLERPVADN